MSIVEEVKQAERLTDINPSEEQLITGKYDKGEVNIRGFNVVIENPIGSIRKGKDVKGKAWATKMNNTYGYFKNTLGSDSDEVDVFLGPILDKVFDVYIINQVFEDNRKFDEHKVMFGFDSEQSAVKAYFSNYSKGWTGFDSVVTISLSEFREWLYSEETKFPIKTKQPMENIVNQSDDMKIVKLYGEVLADETLIDLKKQAGELKTGDRLVMEIASPGGSVAEGLLIMQWMDYLSSKGIQVITVVTANAYSIASLIMLCADVRLISEHGEVMVHNPMVPELNYVNANELEEHVNSLRELEGFMYQLYEVFTGLPKEDISLLMDNETYLNPNEAVQRGFADMVISIKKKPYQMATKPQKTVNMTNTVNVLKQVIAKMSGSDFVNQTYYDQNGGAVEIYQADSSTYQIGDKVSMEDGDVTLADGSKLVIEGGAIKDIIKGEIPAQTEELVEEPVVETVGQDGSTGEVAEPAEVVEQIVEDPKAGEFNTGPAPKDPAVAPKGKDEMPARTIETTESTTTKETIASASEEVVNAVEEEPKTVVEEPEAVADEPVNEAPASPSATPVVVENVSMEAFKALQAKVEEMAATIAKQEEMIANASKQGDEFRGYATEAIQTIAKNTSSSFKPEARITSVGPNPATIGKNSIFQKAKQASLAKNK